MTLGKSAAPMTQIESRIFLIRGQRVMLSTHLAELYEVEPRALVQAIKRNAERFPDDFMFQLNAGEFANLKSQIVTSSWGGLRRAAPYAFTEQGVAMLSSVLRSKRAVMDRSHVVRSHLPPLAGEGWDGGVIMRAFVRLRQILGAHADLARKLAALERKYDSQFNAVFDAIRELMTPPPTKKRSIGFGSWDEKK
jgi:hypothetical protein